MDEKVEDKSEKSKRNHITYYKSLSKIISDIEKEKTEESDPTVQNHLDDRIEAMRKDQTRIKEMFPEVKGEEWDANTD
ncbi:hypothetical protein [Nitrosopumilus sp.]|uniref:hypothetical protein n=1 Tax=Nitrosopumilus sp. TaxID=2024843 RepID=UPI002610054A|nr:hypothetical protein [Nitrosopumilus sp.]